MRRLNSRLGHEVLSAQTRGAGRPGGGGRRTAILTSAPERIGARGGDSARRRPEQPTSSAAATRASRCCCRWRRRRRTRESRGSAHARMDLDEPNRRRAPRERDPRACRPCRPCRAPRRRRGARACSGAKRAARPGSRLKESVSGRRRGDARAAACVRRRTTKVARVPATRSRLERCRTPPPGLPPAGRPRCQRAEGQLPAPNSGPRPCRRSPRRRRRRRATRRDADYGRGKNYVEKERLNSTSLAASARTASLADAGFDTATTLFKTEYKHRWAGRSTRSRRPRRHDGKRRVLEPCWIDRRASAEARARNFVARRRPTTH